MGKIGIIGGTGMYHFEGVRHLQSHNISTPFGQTSDVISEVELDGDGVFFLPRHGKDHRFLPHEINYCANIYALKKLGVSKLVSISSVGSLKEEFAPGSFVFPDQFVDATRGLRRRTFFGEGLVAHVSTAHPVELALIKDLEIACKNANIKNHSGGTYVCIEGPQFSSRAESLIYRQMNADVIGMTNLPEAYLAKEAGIAYATVAMVTDYDCWRDSHCTIEEILKVAKENTIAAQKMIKQLIPLLAKRSENLTRENIYMCVMTPQEMRSSRHKEILEVLAQ